jgi:hypothetical protein
MAQRMVRFSDLTNKMIEDDNAVRIIVDQHPALRNGPIEIEASKDEAESIRRSALDIVSLRIFMDDQSEPELVTLEIEAFDKLAGGMDMGDIIHRAQPDSPLPKKSTPTPATEKTEHTSSQHAGKPHRGEPTDTKGEIIHDPDVAASSRGLWSRGAPAEWIKRSGRCEVCGEPTGQVSSGERTSRRRTWIDTSGTDRVFVRRGDVCAGCWQRHLDFQQSKTHHRQIIR